MSLWNLSMFILALGCVYLCFCRLNMLRLHHKLHISMFHLGLLGLSAATAQHAWTTELDLHDYCSLVVVVSWFCVSYKTWLQGVPEHFRRKGAVLGH